jgi:hypothetical protein
MCQVEDAKCYMPTGESVLVTMQTYIRLTFYSEGAKPSEVIDRLCMLGFKPTRGHQDLVYEWDRNATVQDAIWFADKVHTVLEGLQVHFELETLD